MNRNVAILTILTGACGLLLLLFSGGRQRGPEVAVSAKSRHGILSDPGAISPSGQSSTSRATVSTAGRNRPVESQRPLPVNPSDIPAPTTPSFVSTGSVPASRELADLNHIIAGTLLTDASDLTRMYQLARRIEPQQLAGFVGDKLKSGLLNQSERYNVIWIASKTNSPAMMSVWKGLLTRALPAHPGEAGEWQGWMKEHRSEHLRLMQAEQLRAVSMIGALQDSAAEAHEFLFAFARSGMDIPGDTTMLRLEAARVIYQRNRNGLLRLAAALSDNDPLRDQLNALATSRRGDQ